MRELPLVLLHAYPVDARMWDSVRARLSERTRLITPDLRGLGRTPLPETDREPSLDDAARDVIALLDKLGLEKIVLGGCSMGGYVALALLRLASERVGGLVLIDTKSTADTDDARADRLAVAARAEAEGISGWLAESMLPKLLGEPTRSSRPELVDTVRGLIEDQSPQGVAWAQRAMAARGDSAEVVRVAEVPTVVIVGERDTVTPPQTARDLAGTVADAGLVILPDAGHLTPVEKPAEVADAIVDLFARIRT